jgi:hypothetical protein
MIRRASVQPDTPRTVLPCQGQAVSKKRAARASANQRPGYTEKRQLNVGKATAIEFQKTVVAPRIRKGEDVDCGIVENGTQFVIRHPQAAEP